MKGKRLMGLMLSVSMAIPYMSGVMLIAQAESDAVEAVVSGYISSDSGSFTLAGTKKTPVIYVDSSEHESVSRAMEDLRSDINKVTGVTPSVFNNTEFSIRIESDSAFSYTENGMTLAFSSPVVNGTAYAALYHSNGALKAVVTSDNVSDNAFVFSKKLIAGEGHF